MKILLGILLVFAPMSLSLKAPARKAIAPAADSEAMVLKEAIHNVPGLEKNAFAIGELMNGSHKIADALQHATTTTKNITSFVELERNIEAELEKSHAVDEISKLARFASEKMKHMNFLGIDSVNLGLSRSSAPWYTFYRAARGWKSDNIDNFPLKVIGGVSFFLNIDYSGNHSGLWRICMALGGAGQYFHSNTEFRGSEYGGEEFYFGFANSGNVEGWSWAVDFNHDYVTVIALDDDEEAIGRQLAYQEWRNWRSHMSRLTGGFELTIPGSSMVGINFEYCVLGRTRGGGCVERLESQARQDKEQARLELQRKRSYMPRSNPSETTIDMASDAPSSHPSETSIDMASDAPRSDPSETTIDMASDAPRSDPIDDSEGFSERVPRHGRVENIDFEAVEKRMSEENEAYWKNWRFKNTIEATIGHTWCGKWVNS